jgi:hypothetical protein
MYISIKSSEEERVRRLICQLKGAGAGVENLEESGVFSEQDRVTFYPSQKMLYVTYAGPHMGSNIYMRFYTNAVSSGPVDFSKVFDELPEKYQGIFVFFLDLMERQDNDYV